MNTIHTKRSQKRSVEIYQKLCQSIPGGANSPIRSFQKMEQTPLIAHKGQGPYLYDMDGNRFIDYCGSWGPLIHGHAHPQILEAVHRRLDLGTSFGVSTPIEQEIAAEVQKLVPSMEKLRFVNSGTESTMTALRVARGYTKREKIVKFTGHYHGHVDSLLVQSGSGALGINSTSSSLGVPQAVIDQTILLPFNDPQAVEEVFAAHGDEIAALILEPVAANMGVVPPIDGFLPFLRQITQKYGALLIFDEVITGFRLGPAGAQGVYDVMPDLSCFGKIVGGGFPAACFGGRREIMDCLAPLGGVYQAGTLSGNPVAMEAGLQSLKLLQAPHFYESLEHHTTALVEQIRSLLHARGMEACVQQVGSLFSIFFGASRVENFEQVQHVDAQAFTQMFQKLFQRGIYPPPLFCEAWFVSAAHGPQEFEETIRAFEEVL